jgi:hypothetical protein
MKYISTICLLLLAAGGVRADELLSNGSFEQPMDVGWTDTVVGSTGSSLFEWSDTLGSPTGDHAVRVYKTLASYATLFQTVDIPNVNLVLNLDARLRIGGGSSTCWPTAAILVNYRDGAGTSLGNTRFYLHDQYNTWVSNDTQDLIEVTTPDVWRPYQLNIAEEIATKLPGISAASVAQLQVHLFAYDNGT